VSRAAAIPALAQGQKVVVRNVHLGTLPATVERSDASSVTVTLTVLDARVKRLVGHELAVEVISGRGIHRFGGVLSAQDAGSLTITLSGDVERIQRREFVRIATHLAVSVQGISEDIGGETTTLDVSGSGMRISDQWQLPLGLDVRVKLTLPDGHVMQVLGRVVRIGAAADQKGVRFDDLARGDEDRLMRYIRDREVQALRAARG
jgi:PilZ domain